MRTVMVRWLFLMTGMLALAGCKRSRPVALEDNRVPPAQPPVSLPERPQPLVFYDETGDASERTPALSEGELGKVLDLMAAQTSDHIWLVWVKPARRTGTRGALTAYLIPDETTPEIRTGRAYDIPDLTGQTEVSSPWRYAHVPMPNHNFTEDLTKPPASEMPFMWPTVADSPSPMPKEEVVVLVRFVRQASSYKDWAVRAGRSEDAALPEPYKLPIHRITQTGNRIWVVFGYLHCPLWGYGYRITVEKGPAGYEVTGCGEWVS